MQKRKKESRAVTAKTTKKTYKTCDSRAKLLFCSIHYCFFEVLVAVAVVVSGPGACFSKFPIINGPGKLSPFTLKIEALILYISI